MRRYFLALAVLIIMFGCASTGEMANPPAYSLIKPGSILQLNETLTIPPELARVYFQHGKVVTKLSVDQYTPSCNLLSYVVPEHEQIIHPDGFEVLRVRKYSEFVQAGTILLASNEMRRIDLFNKDNAPMAEVFSIRLDVKSVKNPDIKRFECLVWREPILGKHLSLAEIQQALGNIIEIHL